MSDPEGAARRPRYTTAPLPPYSYVSGFAPHPVSDPRGHLHGAPHLTPPALAPADWQASHAYRRGVDLFNHGYYWEAHEQWESLWLAGGRTGPVAVWLKALIKLAAAGVKAREGNAAGAERHARRSLELAGELRRELPVGVATYCGMQFSRIEGAARAIADAAPTAFIRPQPELLLGEWLELKSTASER